MNDIVALFFSPVFWVATVMVGLLLNLVSNFAYDGIRKFWGRYSAKQHARNEAHDAAIEEAARKCASSPQRLILAHAERTRQNRKYLDSTLLIMSLLFFFLFTSFGVSSFQILGPLGRNVEPSACEVLSR